MNPLSLKPNMHSTVAVSSSIFFLALSDLFSKRQILRRNIHSCYKTIITTSGHIEEAAHFTNRILILVTIDHHIFYAGSHFLPVSERKSRNNSFSIFRRLFSYLYSCKVFAGLRLRCLGNPCISFCRSRYNRFQTTFLFAKPNSFAICCCVFPCEAISLMMGSNSITFSYFLGITKPPMVVLSFYHRRFFFAIVRFYWTCSYRNNSLVLWLRN